AQGIRFHVPSPQTLQKRFAALTPVPEDQRLIVRRVPSTTQQYAGRIGSLARSTSHSGGPCCAWRCLLSSRGCRVLAPLRWKRWLLMANELPTGIQVPRASHRNRSVVAREVGRAYTIEVQPACP